MSTPSKSIDDVSRREKQTFIDYIILLLQPQPPLFDEQPRGVIPIPSSDLFFINVLIPLLQTKFESTCDLDMLHTQLIAHLPGILRKLPFTDIASGYIQKLHTMGHSKEGLQGGSIYLLIMIEKMIVKMNTNIDFQTRIAVTLFRNRAIDTFYEDYEMEDCFGSFEHYYHKANAENETVQLLEQLSLNNV